MNATTRHVDSKALGGKAAVKADGIPTPAALAAHRPGAGLLSAGPQDWQGVITQFCNLLRQICESELVCADLEAQRIIIGMVHCANMTEVDAIMDRLAIRIGELLAARTGDPSELARLVTQARERGRAALARNSRHHGLTIAHEAGPAARMRVRL